MNTVRSTLLAAALAAAIPATAQTPPPLWYIGGGVGRGNLNVSGTELTGLSNAQVDDSATSYTLRAGFRFNPYMAIEGGYYDLGKYSFEGTSAVGNVPVSGTAKARARHSAALTHDRVEAPSAMRVTLALKPSRAKG